MKKSILLLAFIVLAAAASAQTPTKTQPVKIIAPNPKYRIGDTVGVKDSRYGYRMYIITTHGFYHGHSKQVSYDTKDFADKPWYRLRESAIIVVNGKLVKK